MKFEDLYKNIFIAEQEDEIMDSDESSEIAMPEDFDDVKPAPVPEIPVADTADEPAVSPVASQTNVQGYIDQLENFADTLNNTSGDSLQTLVANLDKEGTPFEGLSSRTKAEITRAAEIMRTISEQLKSFIIGAAKVS